MQNYSFLKPAEFYQRDIDPINQYLDQTSFYLSKMTGRDIKECHNKVVANLKDKQKSTFNDPTVNFMNRGDNKDTFRDSIKLSNYIKEVIQNKEILAPTFTTYINTDQERSMLVEFIDANVKRRSVAKKASFVAKAAGDINLYIAKDNEQANMKTYNNSASGAFAAAGSILKNDTAHSTLTSMTRTESSLGNASNEKIIAGNRHYRNADVTLNNIIYIVSSIDRASITRVIEKYNLYIPTVEDVRACIKHSTEFYWRNNLAFDKIDTFINTLDGIERAAFIYTGDLFHIRKHNSLLVRTLLTRLSEKISNVEVPEPLAVIKKIEEQIINFAHQICSKEVKGIGKDHSKLDAIQLNTLVATCLNIQKVIGEYFDFFDSLFLTKAIPSSTAYLPNMVRRSVILSDTDSTMFSVDEFIHWYFGGIIFTEQAFAIAASVMFIATECIAHTLAMFSANLNVERPKLFNIAMKPEYTFPVFVQTSVAKHYFTFKTVQEGQVFKEPEMEIKGVHLKNSSAPRSIILPAHAKMKEILTKVINNEKINLLNEIKDVTAIENTIINSLNAGKTEFFGRAKIKDKTAYKLDADKSLYQHYTFWNDVFKPKYGEIEPPTYNVIKIPTILNNATSLKKWIANMVDQELAMRLEIWLIKHPKIALPTLYISSRYVEAYGIPVEIKAIINIKSIVLNLTLVNRMILESLGYFPKHKLMLNEIGY